MSKENVPDAYAWGRKDGVIMNRFQLPLAVVASVTVFAAPVFVSADTLTAFGTNFSENFNTLASSGTSSTLPGDWALSESLTNANTTYTAGTGSSATGDTYSFGAASSSERALGMLRSGNLASIIGSRFTNDTGGTINSLTIEYDGEQWRLGATGRADRIDFQYSLDATSLTTGTWVDVNALDFSSPNTTTTGQLDGNANSITNISSTISLLSIPDETNFWIRWTDSDIAGSEDGLAVDNFSIQANGTLPPAAVPLPPAILAGFGLFGILGGVRVLRRR